MFTKVDKIKIPQIKINTPIFSIFPQVKIQIKVNPKAKLIFAKNYKAA